VDVRVDFDAGGRREPAEKAGLASVTVGMTAKGVAAHGTEPALDENPPPRSPRPRSSEAVRCAEPEIEPRSTSIRASIDVFSALMTVPPLDRT